MDRIVLKIGTAVLNPSDLSSFNEEVLSAPSKPNPSDTKSGHQAKINQILGSVVPHLPQGQLQLIVVSSGAVAFGAQQLAIPPGQKKSLSETQMCASIGQAQLMETYSRALQKYNYLPAQILLTSADLQNSTRRQNLITCLHQMQSRRVLPIVNENDVLSTEEIEPLPDNEAKWFSDNDKLSSLLAVELEAKALVILTTGKGIFKSKPTSDQDNPLHVITNSIELDSVDTWQGTSQGRGGIRSKIESIKYAVKNQIPCWVTSGKDCDGLQDFFKGFTQRRIPKSGTFVLAGGDPWMLS